MMKINESKPDDKVNLAPVLKCCPHTPLTDEELWHNPQDAWCDHCQCSCCRKCFETEHKNCEDRTGTSMTRQINKKRAEEKAKEKAKKKSN